MVASRMRTPKFCRTLVESSQSYCDRHSRSRPLLLELMRRWLRVHSTLSRLYHRQLFGHRAEQLTAASLLLRSFSTTKADFAAKATQRSLSQLEERIAAIPISRYRNFCIVAHVDHGKSTLSDRLLELTGTIEPGSENKQILDKLDVERERGITVKAQTCSMIYNHRGDDYLLHLVDTPGHVDFRAEVSRSYASCGGGRPSPAQALSFDSLMYSSTPPRRRQSRRSSPDGRQLLSRLLARLAPHPSSEQDRPSLCRTSESTGSNSRILRIGSRDRGSRVSEDGHQCGSTPTRGHRTDSSTGRRYLCSSQDPLGGLLVRQFPWRHPSGSSL